MSNKRQSAVDYLFSELINRSDMPYEDSLELFRKAKEKQRQQLDHAFINGKFVYTNSDETSEQYYEENYE